MACGSGLTRGAASLTHRSIEALRPAEVAYRVTDQRCIGLAVRVAPSSVKTWDLAYRIRGSGKVRRISLGRVSDVTLEKARERSNELTGAARAGRDLIAEEEESQATAAARLTVEKLVESISGVGSPTVCGRRMKSGAVLSEHSHQYYCGTPIYPPAGHSGIAGRCGRSGD